MKSTASSTLLLLRVVTCTDAIEKITWNRLQRFAFVGVLMIAMERV
jgi:hypothetical protein